MSTPAAMPQGDVAGAGARFAGRARAFWVLLFAALAALDWLLVVSLPLHHDIAWPLYVGNRVLGGAHLYVDLFDVHPPLIMWWGTLSAAVARTLGVADHQVYHALALAAVGLSLLLGGRLLARLLPQRPWERGILLALQAFLLFPFVGYSLGQEEHLMLALVWPYLLAVALAARGERIGRDAWLVGMAAALGFAFKPFYALAWLALEAYLALARRAWRPRPETLLVAAGLAAYVAAIALFTPAYFHMLLWAAGVYSYYFVAPLAAVVASWGTYLVVCAVLADFLPRTRELGGLRRIVTIALVVCTLIVYLQRKGWTYHWYPAVALAVYALAIAALEQLEGRVRMLARRAPAALAGAALAAALLGGAAAMDLATRKKVGQLDYHPYYLPAMRYTVETFGRGGPIVAISDIMQPVFPLVNYTGMHYGSRFSCLWMLEGLYARERMREAPFPYHDAAHTTALEQYMIDAVITDIERNRPTLILLDRNPPFMLPGFNYLQYFARDARFRAIARHYAPIAQVQRWIVLSRVD